MENSNMICIFITIDSWCWESFLIWIEVWVYLMFMMMLDDKFQLEHIFSQSTMPNIIVEGLETEISIDKLNTIFSSTNKFPAEIGLG